MTGRIEQKERSQKSQFEKLTGRIWSGKKLKMLEGQSDKTFIGEGINANAKGID